MYFKSYEDFVKSDIKIGDKVNIECGNVKIFDAEVLSFWWYNIKGELNKTHLVSFLPKKDRYKIALNETCVFAGVVIDFTTKKSYLTENIYNFSYITSVQYNNESNFLII